MCTDPGGQHQPGHRQPVTADNPAGVKPVEHAARQHRNPAGVRYRPFVGAGPVMCHCGSHRSSVEYARRIRPFVSNTSVSVDTPVCVVYVRVCRIRLFVSIRPDCRAAVGRWALGVPEKGNSDRAPVPTHRSRMGHGHAGRTNGNGSRPELPLRSEPCPEVGELITGMLTVPFTQAAINSAEQTAAWKRCRRRVAATSSEIISRPGHRVTPTPRGWKIPGGGRTSAVSFTSTNSRYPAEVASCGTPEPIRNPFDGPPAHL